MDQMGFQMPGMATPQLMNPPPPIFGPYGADGLPVQQLPPDLAGHMFSDNVLMEDTNEAKRRRIARACDMCRKKKIKCDGKLPACSHCVNYKTECVFTQVEKKRTPPKGAKYIEGLEKRLGRMEHLLRLSGLLDEDDNGATDLGELEKKLEEKTQKTRKASTNMNSGSTSPSLQTHTGVEGNMTPQTPLTSPTSGNTRDADRDRDMDEKDRTETSPDDNASEDEVEGLSEMMDSLVTNHHGETRYFGSSSGFSIFSPKGIQWVNERTGDSSFQRMISEVSLDDHKWTNWKPEIFNDLFQRPIYRPLPPKNEALSLLKDYFENFNCMFPLFHQPTFMHLVERHYSSEPYEGSGWWASLNCALAFAHRLRVMSNLVPQEEDEKAWGYIKNAMGVFSELTMRNTDLLSVQALLAMALFMQGTPNPQPTSHLSAAAIRLAHSIGLHKRGTGFNLNPIEIEQRKRVFWIAYLIDKDLSLRSGRPPAQPDDDMNVELPEANPDDNIGNIPLADGKGKMNLFRAMCELTVIESNVYRRLYSTTAMKQSPGELLNSIGELDQQLEDWKDSIPIDFRPEHEIKASHTPLILHIVMLHLNYYNCLTTIHRMSVHHGYWSSRLSNYALQGLNARPLNPRVFMSAALCTAAARASISLLKYIPQGDFSCVWLILYFPVSALMSLFGNILQNPLDPRAKSDLRLMNLVVTFLSMLGQEAEQGGVNRMLGVCSEFERISKAVIEKTEKEQSSRRKRKGPDGHARVSSTATTSKHTGGAGPNLDAPRSATATPSVASHDASAESRQSATVTPASTSRTDDKSAAVGQASPMNAKADRASSPSPIRASEQGTSPLLSSAGWPQEHAVPQSGDFNSYSGMNAFFPGVPASSSAFSMPFQQPLLPQDLFSLPESLDWNWAEMSGGAYPSVENGTFGGEPPQSSGEQER